MFRRDMTPPSASRYENIMPRQAAAGHDENFIADVIEQTTSTLISAPKAAYDADAQAAIRDIGRRSFGQRRRHASSRRHEKKRCLISREPAERLPAARFLTSAGRAIEGWPRRARLSFCRRRRAPAIKNRWRYARAAGTYAAFI